MSKEKDDNRDLLDLCKLNLMEPNVSDSPANDRDVTMKAIEWKKRHLTVRIGNAMHSSVTPEMLERHVQRNTLDGIYPWTEAMPIVDPPEVVKVEPWK